MTPYKRIILRIAAAVLLLTGLSTPCRGETAVDSLTYAVYPYLPDAGYYQELIEQRWAEIEPDIRLIRAEWDCYEDGVPEGIDVIMYDAEGRDRLIGAGWLQPIDPSRIQEIDDIYPFALEGLTVDGKLYGIPVFLCGNFLIYDISCGILAGAEHLTDLAGESELLAISSDDKLNRKQFIFEILADIWGEPHPPVEGGAEEMLALIDELAIDEYQQDKSAQLAAAYDAGVGSGYINFSESMRFLEERISQTDIKAISFSDRDNLPLLYVDAVSVTAGVEGPRYEKCVELMNVIAEADVLRSLSVQDGRPRYLLLARRSPYAALAEEYPLYHRLEALASDDNNRVIVIP